MKSIKAPWISPSEIHQKADEFWGKYSKNQVPVDIIAIAEFELGIEFRAIGGLSDIAGTAAFITSDFKIIFVDSEQFMNDVYEARLRFSIAHEIGHLILHKDFFEALKINSLEDYIELFDKIQDEQYFYIEQHAYEFAGRLLVPRERLHKSLQTMKQRVPDSLIESSEKDLVIPYLSIPISREFGVSQGVIERRIKKEGLL